VSGGWRVFRLFDELIAPGVTGARSTSAVEPAATPATRPSAASP